MSEVVVFENIEDLIIEIRERKVLLDSDIAKIYGIETRDINKAVKNNPDKFPNEGYIFELTRDELENLRWKFSTANLSKTRVLPKAFSEKGLYMLDHCEGIDLAYHQGKPGETCNIGGRNERTNLQIANKICELLDEMYPIKNSSTFKIQKRRYFEQ